MNHLDVARQSREAKKKYQNIAKELAEEYDISETTLRTRLENLGQKVKSEAQIKAEVLRPKIVEYANAHVSQRVIAKVFGVSVGYVQRQIYAHRKAQQADTKTACT